MSLTETCHSMSSSGGKKGQTHTLKHTRTLNDTFIVAVTACWGVGWVEGVFFVNKEKLKPKKCTFENFNWVLSLKFSEEQRGSKDSVKGILILECGNFLNSNVESFHLFSWFFFSNFPHIFVLFFFLNINKTPQPPSVHTIPFLIQQVEKS